MKKIKFFVMPLFIFIALITTGYSTWYFLDSIQTSTDKDVSINVEGLSSAGVIKIPNKNDIKLTFSQNNILLNQQIMVLFDYNKEAKPFEEIIFDYSLLIIDKEGQSLKLSDYVEVHSKYLEPDLNSPNLYSGRWYPIKEETSNQYIFETDLFFSYKLNKRPKTEEEVIELLKFKGYTIKITFSAY